MFEKGMELKAEFGEDSVCDFSLGNPDVPPPAATKRVLEEIAQSAVRPLGLGYCPNAGLMEVRKTMAERLSAQQRTPVAAKDVVMTTGAAGALVSFFRAVVEPGDEIITPAPYFVEYGAYCGHFGGVLKPVPSLPPSFRPDIDAIAAAVTEKTRAIIINSPNNPTGCIYDVEDLRRIAELVDKVNESRERPLFLLSDEPYRAFAYDGVEVPAVLPLTRFACVLGSFSKTLSLVGERIGYFVAHPLMPDQASLTAAVTLDDGGLKLNAFEFGNMECNITGSRRKVAVIMTGTIALAVAGALITFGIDELVGFMLQKGIESLFNTAFDEVFQFALYSCFVQLYNVIRHGTKPPLRFN
jgi:aspartate aminotransferase